LTAREAAGPHSWKHEPAPAQREPLGFSAHYDAAMVARMRLGEIPADMDDRWFIYFDAGWLRFHRSWTGVWIYALQMQDDGQGGWNVVDSWVNRDPTQYRMEDIPADRESLARMIDYRFTPKP